MGVSARTHSQPESMPVHRHWAAHTQTAKLDESGQQIHSQKKPKQVAAAWARRWGKKSPEHAGYCLVDA
jgi:hypothetical protein